MSDDIATDDRFIDFKCPCCGADNSFPATTCGTVQECVNCTEAIIAPPSGSEGRKIPLPITTPRLILRKFRGADWKDMMHLFADDDFYSAAPFKVDGEDQIARWLEEDAVVKLSSPGVPYILAVQEQETGKVVGCLSLSFTEDRLQAGFYLVVHRDFQKRGFGTEAARGLFDFCFNGISLHRIMARCYSSDAAACAMLQKTGMRREGEFVRSLKVENKWINESAYAILSDEFKPTP